MRILTEANELLNDIDIEFMRQEAERLDKLILEILKGATKEDVK